MSATRKRQRLSQPRGAPKQVSANGRPPTPPDPLSITLTVNLDQLKFLAVLLANANIQPAEFKQRCGEIQQQVEEKLLPHIPQQG